MERHRGKALAFSVALSCLVTTTPSRSQSAHTTLIEWRHGTPEHSLPLEPFSLERGEDVPKDLLDGLAERADSYRYLLDRFTCTERIRRRGKQPVLRDYLLVGVEDVQKLREIRFAGERRVKDPDNPMPPPMAWSLLFSEDYQPHFVYRYLGYGLGGFDGGHRILFRGNRWFEKDKDIREWEGVSLDFKELQPKEVLEQIGEKVKLDIQVRGLLPKEPRLTKSFANATVKEILSWYAREVPVIYKAKNSEKLVVLVNTEDVSGDTREAS